MIPPIADRFVAGESAEIAIEHVRECNEEGISGILNLLGEHYTHRAVADADARAYRRLLRRMDEAGVEGCISVKPTQIGLDVGFEAFEESLDSIVEAAGEHDRFVWIDMEDHTTTDATLEAFETHAKATGGDVGVCVQSNLKRTSSDLERLAGLPGKVRLVKGAYDEPPSIAHTEKTDIDEAYREHLTYAFREFEGVVAVGSHDPEMISLAADLHAEFDTPYEVQMLMGVREHTQRELAASGVPTYQYVPYGDKWASYFYRRIRERKSNALFALRAILGR